MCIFCKEQKSKTLQGKCASIYAFEKGNNVPMMTDEARVKSAFFFLMTSSCAGIYQMPSLHFTQPVPGKFSHLNPKRRRCLITIYPRSTLEIIFSIRLMRNSTTFFFSFLNDSNFNFFKSKIPSIVR